MCERERPSCQLRLSNHRECRFGCKFICTARLNGYITEWPLLLLFHINGVCRRSVNMDGGMNQYLMRRCCSLFLPFCLHSHVTLPLCTFPLASHDSPTHTNTHIQGVKWELSIDLVKYITSRALLQYNLCCCE